MNRYLFDSNTLEVETKRIPQYIDSIEELTILLEDNSFANALFYIEFSCPKHKKFITKPLQQSGKYLYFTLPLILTLNSGEIFIQITVREAESFKMLQKSLVSQEPIIIVEPSINTMNEIADSEQDLVASIFDTVEKAKAVSEQLLNDKINGVFDGKKGDNGPRGESAYEVAVGNGFVGSEAEWLESLEAQNDGASQGLFVDKVSDVNLADHNANTLMYIKLNSNDKLLYGDDVYFEPMSSGEILTRLQLSYDKIGG